MPSIIQEWVAALPLRHQGVLVSSVRGCDTAPRHDTSKLLSRCLRAEILVPAVEKPTSYIEFVDRDTLLDRMEKFLGDWDHYPLHFCMHLVHAAEVVAYYHPTNGEPWLMFYRAACKKLHFRPESKEDLEARLTAPEEKFRAAQDAKLRGET